MKSINNRMKQNIILLCIGCLMILSLLSVIEMQDMSSDSLTMVPVLKVESRSNFDRIVYHTDALEQPVSISSEEISMGSTYRAVRRVCRRVIVLLLVGLPEYASLLQLFIGICSKFFGIAIQWSNLLLKYIHKKDGKKSYPIRSISNVS